MGLHNSWIAVRDASAPELSELFSSEKKSFRKYLSYLELSSGWSVVGHSHNGFHGRGELIAASELGFAIRLDIYDNVDPFLSILTAAQDGQVLWEVSIIDDEWKIEGEPPIAADAMPDLLDGFEGFFGDQHDIPPALAKMVSGFDFVEWFPLYVEPPPPPPSIKPESWWSRLAGMYGAWSKQEVGGFSGHASGYAYLLIHVGILVLIFLAGRWLYERAAALIG